MTVTLLMQEPRFDPWSGGQIPQAETESLHAARVAAEKIPNAATSRPARVRAATSVVSNSARTDAL